MKKNDVKLTIVMVSVFIIVTAVWFVSFNVISYLFGKPNDAGSTGDLFGAVGALFSGWAFVGILWAILLQRKSLQIQHNDLMASLKEMKQAREAHEESVETLRKQVEITRIQTRVEILKTLIDLPIQIQGNKFLEVFREKVSEQQKDFKENLKELKKLSTPIQR